jgi:hypothetical protein
MSFEERNVSSNLVLIAMTGVSAGASKRIRYVIPSKHTASSINIGSAGLTDDDAIPSR